MDDVNEIGTSGWEMHENFRKVGLLGRKYREHSSCLTLIIRPRGI